VFRCNVLLYTQRWLWKVKIFTEGPIGIGIGTLDDFLEIEMNPKKSARGCFFLTEEIGKHKNKVVSLAKGGSFTVKLDLYDNILFIEREDDEVQYHFREAIGVFPIFLLGTGQRISVKFSGTKLPGEDSSAHSWWYPLQNSIEGIKPSTDIFSAVASPAFKVNVPFIVPFGILFSTSPETQFPIWKPIFIFDLIDLVEKSNLALQALENVLKIGTSKGF
jgi:hypothetical protein